MAAHEGGFCFRTVGGLPAAKVREQGREGPRVICLNSPTWAAKSEAIHPEEARQEPDSLVSYGP
jgi:hypothetical protein